MLEKLIRELVARRAEMERAVFEHPPADWADFKKRQGQWIELETLLQTLQEALKGKEKDS